MDPVYSMGPGRVFILGTLLTPESCPSLPSALQAAATHLEGPARVTDVRAAGTPADPGSG